MEWGGVMSVVREIDWLVRFGRALGADPGLVAEAERYVAEAEGLSPDWVEIDAVLGSLTLAEMLAGDEDDDDSWPLL